MEKDKLTVGNYKPGMEFLLGKKIPTFDSSKLQFGNLNFPKENKLILYNTMIQQELNYIAQKNSHFFQGKIIK